MSRMFLATRAILAQFHAARVITAIFLGGVIPLFTITALKRDHRADIFFLGSHLTTLLSPY
jgi:hypothetical protein